MTACLYIALLLLAFGSADAIGSSSTRPVNLVAGLIALIGCAFALAVIERGWP